jgi:hypothetical protein
MKGKEDPENNIKMDLIEKGCEGVDWNHVGQVIGDFLSSWAIVNAKEWFWSLELVDLITLLL